MAERTTNPFDAPVPGQSLTDTPKNYPWEHAPQFSTVEDSSMQIWEGLNTDESMDKILILLESGMTVEELVKVIIFAGFVDGKFTPDTGLLLSPLVSKMIMAIAKKAGIKKIKINKPKEDSTKELIKTVMRASPDKEEKVDKEVEEMPSTGLMGKPKEEEK